MAFDCREVAIEPRQYEEFRYQTTVIWERKHAADKSLLYFFIAAIFQSELASCFNEGNLSLIAQPSGKPTS
jgi:hypothetical protein